MKFYSLKTLNLVKHLSLVILLGFSCTSFGDSLNALIDDFNDTSNDNLGVPRQFLNDSISGGNTTTNHQVVQGVITATGEIVPPRGQPGWASMVLPLNAQNLPRDASAFTGIRLLIKINTGSLSISANSSGSLSILRCSKSAIFCPY